MRSAKEITESLEIAKDYAKEKQTRAGMLEKPAELWQS